MNKRLTTDMVDANGLQRALRPTGFFNIKMAADFCSAQCIMDNTGSLTSFAALNKKVWLLVIVIDGMCFTITFFFCNLKKMKES